jgi:hypothetical protein
MIVHVDDNSTTASVNEAFGANFPFLRLAFFKKSHGQGEISKRADQLADDARFGEYRKKHGSGDLIITPAMIVSDLEDAFELHFALHVQVLRRQGKSWIVTGITDTWTLERQNSEGEVLSTEVEE